MGLLARLRRALVDSDTRSVALIDPSTLNYFGANAATANLLPHVPAQALAVPTVYASVRMLSRDVSSMPWAAYFKGTNERVPEQPTILRRPDPFEAVERTRAKVTSSLLLRGNSFSRLTAPGRDGRPTVAIPIPYEEVHVSWNESQTRPVYRWRGVPLELGTEIMHLKYLDLGPEYLLGLGPIQAARVSLSGAIRAEQYAEGFYADAQVPDGVLTAPGTLTKGEADLLREQWVAARADSRATALLSGGVTFEAITVNNADAQYIESRQFSVSDIARLFGIPGGKLGATQSGSSLTYTNLESLNSQYASDAVRPVSEELEIGFGDLLPSTQEIRFDYLHLVRADAATRFAIYETGIRSGIITRNEARENEGRPPIAGGDELEAPTATDPAPATTEE